MDYASSLLGLLPGGRRTPGLKELLATVGSYLPPDQVARVRAAAEFGASAHQGQKRLSGEPYIAHPVATAAILADLRLDADTLVAAIGEVLERRMIDACTGDPRAVPGVGEAGLAHRTVVVADEAEGRRLAAELATVPDWAPGLPLAAAGFEESA